MRQDRRGTSGVSHRSALRFVCTPSMVQSWRRRECCTIEKTRESRGEQDSSQAGRPSQVRPAASSPTLTGGTRLSRAYPRAAVHVSATDEHLRVPARLADVRGAGARTARGQAGLPSLTDICLRQFSSSAAACLLCAQGWRGSQSARGAGARRHGWSAFPSRRASSLLFLTVRERLFQARSRLASLGVDACSIALERRTWEVATHGPLALEPALARSLAHELARGRERAEADETARVAMIKNC